MPNQVQVIDKQSFTTLMQEDTLNEQIMYSKVISGGVLGTVNRLRITLELAGCDLGIDTSCEVNCCGDPLYFIADDGRFV